MNKKYFIRTYGCQMNVHDSEKIAGMLKELNYIEANSIENADIIIFNTCCIRDGAEQKIYAHIGATKNLKKNNPNLIIAICGCMTQADNRAETILKKFPYVNIIFGTHNIHLLKDYLNSYNLSHKKVVDIWEKEKGIFEDITTYRTSGNNAWVNISYGCNNFCTYCIVPYVRGRERSRNIVDIENEVKSLIKDGYKYITLLGQNVNSYGNDIEDKNINFANLLKKLSNLEGDFKIKFMTSHPKDLSTEVIDVISNSPKIAKVIHLPVQSGSNKILKLMNRNYTCEKYLSLIKEIRAKIPNCYISTDIIVGFPNETDDDFNQTLELLNEVRFDGVFGFMYSIRSGTVAEKMSGHIDKIIKNKRVNELLKLSKTIIKEKNIEMIGKSYSILVSNYDKINKIYNCVTDSGKNIIVRSKLNLEENVFYDCKIIKVSGNKLFGEI